MQKLRLCALVLFLVMGRVYATQPAEVTKNVMPAAKSLVSRAINTCAQVKASVGNAVVSATDKKVVAAFIVGGIVVCLLMKSSDIYAYFTQEQELSEQERLVS